MNKEQFVASLAEQYDGDRAAAAHALDSVTYTLTRALAKGDRVALSGFASFDRRVVKSRWVRNPRTGERILARATAVARFRPGAQLKAIVAGTRDLPAPPKPLPAAKKPKAKKSVPAVKMGSKKAVAKKSVAPGSTDKKTADKNNKDKNSGHNNGAKKKQG